MYFNHTDYTQYYTNYTQSNTNHTLGYIHYEQGDKQYTGIGVEHHTLICNTLYKGSELSRQGNFLETKIW